MSDGYRKKTICIRHSYGHNARYCIGGLKRALEKCNDKSPVEILLRVGNLEKEDFQIARLNDLCSLLYHALIDAKRCVETCTNIEANTSEKTIYYDKRSGRNGGAQDMLKDIDEVLKHFYKERVQIDLCARP